MKPNTSRPTSSALPTIAPPTQEAQLFALRELTLELPAATSEPALAEKTLDVAAKLFPGRALCIRVVDVRTREPDYEGPAGHVDAVMLKRLLAGCDRSAHCFVCGPPAMMRACVSGLKAAGFSRERIHTERFAL